MLKKLIWFAAIALCAVSASAQKTQLTGQLKNPDGTGFNGYLYMSLAQVAAISPNNGCGGSVLAIPVTNVVIHFVNGSMVIAPKVYGSDCTLPVGIPYNVVAKDNNGNTVFTDQWLITGATQDIGAVQTCDGCTPLPATIPQSFTAPTGYCINAYNATTGTWTTAACASGTGGTVSSVSAGTTPTWLTLTVGNPTTTPVLSISATGIPNSGLQNSSFRLGTTTVNLGDIISSALGVNITGSAGSTNNLAGGGVGSIPYQSASFTTSFVTGNSAATDQVLVSHGTGTAAAAPFLSNAPALSAVNMSGYPVATASTFGIVKPDGTSCTVSAGVISCPAPVSSVFGRTGAVTAQTGDYSVAQITGAAPLASPTFTGTVNIPFTTIIGGTPGSGQFWGYNGTSQGWFTPTGSGTTGQTLTAASTGGAAPGTTFNGSTAVTLDYHSFGAAPLASPALTGTPTAPTASLNTNTTQLATTAYVAQEITVNVNCGTTTTCANTVVANPLKHVWGSAALTAGTATVSSISPAFTDTTTPKCGCQDSTTGTNACSAVLASTSSVTLTGSTTDTVQYSCWGP